MAETDVPRLFGIVAELALAASTESNDEMAERIEALDLPKEDLEIVLGAALKGVAELTKLINDAERREAGD